MRFACWSTSACGPDDATIYTTEEDTDEEAARLEALGYYMEYRSDTDGIIIARLGDDVTYDLHHKWVKRP